MIDKVLKYRIFEDENVKMGLNIQQIQGNILLVSQFTLMAKTNKELHNENNVLDTIEIQQYNEQGEYINTLYHEFVYDNHQLKTINICSVDGGYKQRVYP